jgi:hypothetical protein
MTPSDSLTQVIEEYDRVLNVRWEEHGGTQTNASKVIHLGIHFVTSPQSQRPFVSGVQAGLLAKRVQSYANPRCRSVPTPAVCMTQIISSRISVYLANRAWILKREQENTCYQILGHL